MIKKFARRALYWLLILLLFFIAYFVYILDDAVSISKGIPIPDYGAQKTALLVIDIQEGTTGKFASEQFYIDQAPPLIENVNKAISLAFENDIPVIYILQQTENWLLNWLDDYVMAPGSLGVPVDERLKAVSLSHFTKKKSDAFSSYAFEKHIQTLKVNRLIITGLDIAYCANKTSYAAMNRGYEVFILEDAVISENEELKNEKISELKADGAHIIDESQLREILGNN